MIPSSIATLVAFVLLIAPGLVADLEAGRHRAGAKETTFRELSRTVLFSLGCSGAAALIVVLSLILFRVAGPAQFHQVVTDAAYRTEHVLGILGALLATSIAGCVMAWAIQRLRYRKIPLLQQISAWRQVMREDIAKGQDPYARVRLSNGYSYYGVVAWYTDSIEADGRELVLTQPMYIQAPDSIEVQSVPAEWPQLVLRGNDIQALFVRAVPRSAVTPAIGAPQGEASSSLPQQPKDEGAA